MSNTIRGINLRFYHGAVYVIVYKIVHMAALYFSLTGVVQRVYHVIARAVLMV